MAETLFRNRMLQVAKELTAENVKDLEFIMEQMHAPWTSASDGDGRVVIKQMKQRMIWFFDSKSKTCNFARLAGYMEDIWRHDLGAELRHLGKASC